jgi:hypothetical protein
MMTRKHYRAIAEVLNAEYLGTTDDVVLNTVHRIARRLGAVLAEDNPQFDHQCFMEAVVTRPSDR